MKRLVLFLMGGSLGFGLMFFAFRWISSRHVEIEIPELRLSSLSLSKRDDDYGLKLKFRVRAQCELGIMDQLEMDWHDSESKPFVVSLESLEDESLNERISVNLKGFHLEQNLLIKSLGGSATKLIGLFLCSESGTRVPCKNKRSLSPTNSIIENLQKSKSISDKRFLFYPLVLEPTAKVHFLNVGSLHDSQLPSLRARLSQLLGMDSESKRANQLLSWLKSNMNSLHIPPLEVENGSLVIPISKHEASLCQNQ